jgi:hypothetical protein
LNGINSKPGGKNSIRLPPANESFFPDQPSLERNAFSGQRPTLFHRPGFGAQISQTQPMDSRTATQTANVMKEPEQIIELITKQTKVLLNNHWADITDFRDSEESIKVGFSSLIQYQGQERVVETTISFGKRVKDSTVEQFNTEQLNFDDLKPAIPAPLAKRGPGRPKKNLLETKLSNAPSPDPRPEAA